MSYPLLTDERRQELATLLDDTTRLRREHPKLAEYIEIGPALPGTGNDEEDAAFDLRLAHYLTCDRSVSPDPYWEIVRPAVSRRDTKRVVDGGNVSGSGRLGFAQMVLQDAYAYAIPSPETIAWITEVSEGRPIVELGAGRGYWAAQMSRAGLDVSAYDVAPPQLGENTSFSDQPSRTIWHEVAGLQSMPPLSRDAVLLLCWPPGWGDNMALTALRSYADTGGDRFIYVGEPKGGKNATNEFFAALSTEWKLIGTDPDFVSWWNLSDSAQVWSRGD